MTDTYDLKAILEIIFTITKKNAKTLADEYLLKDVSIISKWKNNVVYPRSYDISKIIEFVVSESTVSQKGIIRDNIEELLRKAPIKNKFKEIVFNTENFGEFLKEAISVSVFAFEQTAEDICIVEDRSIKNMSKTDNETKQNGSYTGTVELDFILPEGADVNLQNLPAGTGIEFKGKLNLTPRKRILKVANFLKSRSVLGVIIIWALSSSTVALFTVFNKNNSTLLSTKNGDEYSTPSVTNLVKNETLSSYTPAPKIEVPSFVPSPSIQSPVPSPIQITEKNISRNPSTYIQKENKDNTTINTNKNITKNAPENITKNTTKDESNNASATSGNINVNVNGDGNIVVAGPQSGVTFEER